MTIKLSQLPEGSTGVIVGLQLPDNLVERLLGMGFVVVEKVETIRQAPLGDPTVYRIMGTDVTLRSELSSSISVETLLIPLSACSAGKYSIVRVLSGRGFSYRAARQDLVEGAEIDVIDNECGPLKVVLDGKTRLIPRGHARKIMVRENN